MTTNLANKRVTPIFVLKIILALLGLVCTAIVGTANTVADGLGAFFLLPLSFSFACLFSRNAISYAKDSFGLLILYALIVLRYLVSPVLTALSGQLVQGLSTSASGLRFAILIMIVELFVVVIAVNVIWKPFSYDSKQMPKKHTGNFNLTWIGFITCLFLIVVLLFRGNLSNVFEHLSFGKKYSFSYSALKTYDMSTVLMLKAFLFIIITSWASKKYHNAKSRINKSIYLLIAILAAIANSLIYDASNRATMVMFAMSSLAVLLYCFGKKISRLIPIIAILGFIFVWSLFSYGTLGVREGESLFGRSNYMADLSRVAELYSNGVSTEAHAFDMYDTIAPQINIYTHISELIKSNNVFTLPGFWEIGRWVESIPSIQGLFNSTLNGQAYILPNSGLAMYGGSQFFGWIIDILFHWLMVCGIYFLYKKKKQSNNIAKVYLYSYCEMICGFILINNIMIAIGLITAVPFLLYVLLKINNLGSKIQ